MPRLNPNPPETESRAAGTQLHQLPEEALLLRIFVGEDDRQKHLPLYEAIVLKARELHLAGATVFRGLLGFGRSSHMHSAKILRLSTDLPIVIEIVDTQEKIDAFLPHLERMMGGGLVTLERVQIIHDRVEPIRKSAKDRGRKGFEFWVLGFGF
jgi:uncharacterized protein